jgi:hypothetical protein
VTRAENMVVSTACIFKIMPPEDLKVSKGWHITQRNTHISAMCVTEDIPIFNY